MAAETDGYQEKSADIDRGVSLRAIAMGVIGVAVVGIGFPYVEYVVQATRPANTAIPFGVIFLFAFLVAVVNPLLAFARRRWLLARSELLVIFVMLLIASAVPTWGLIGQLIPIISGAQYYAAPENRWQELVVDRVPDWTMIKHQGAVNTFYEGLAAGNPIPWGPWITPLLAWSVFIFGLYAATLETRSESRGCLRNFLTRRESWNTGIVSQKK